MTIGTSKHRVWRVLGTASIIAVACGFSVSGKAAFAGMGGSGGGGSGGGGCGGCGGGGGGDGTALTTFVTDDFSGSGNCAMCHSALRDSAGNDVSLDTHWRSTMMANAGKDPLWQAKISSEVARNPALREVIEDKCSRCHLPMARVQAITDNTPVAVLDGGFLSSNHYLHAAATDGVSCALCHQIQSTGLGQPDSFTGHYVIDTTTAPPYRLIFGQYSNPMLGPMRMHVGYTPVLGNHLATSGLCGSCHTLYTPAVDASGQVIGEFPEQMTYLEWLHSGYSAGGTYQDCQDCHMVAAVGSVRISNRPMRLTARRPFSQHHLVGGNFFTLGLLRDHIADVGVTASAAQMDATIDRTISQLQSATGSLAVLNAGLSAGTLTVDLQVRNEAGHKVPSGVPARRAWLHMLVTDRHGRTVFESGAPQSDGSIAGNDADEGSMAYEPHYDLISQSDQVQVYESIMQDTDGLVTYTFLRAYTYAKDNRLLPGGFDKATAAPDIAVHGEAAGDADFVGGSDNVRYTVSTQGFTAPFAVSAEFLYQPAGYRFVQDLREDATDLVQTFGDYYDQADKTPVVLAAVERFVQ